MVNSKNKFAFSLAEALMSMIILSIVAICIMPILSKQKPGEGVNSTAIKGAFLCYYNSRGQLTQVSIHERTQESNTSPSNSQCQFNVNKRAARFYYIATGGGSANARGQVKTGYTSDISDTIIIKPGTANNKTTIEMGGNPIVAGKGFNQVVVPSNIKSCKYISGNCVNATGRPTGCELDTTHSYINLIGCVRGGDYHDQEQDFISINSIEKVNAANMGRFQPNSDQQYTSYQASSVKFNLDLLDSSYDNTREDESYFSQILSNMNPSRQNKYFDELINLEPGMQNKPGAVAILW